MAVLLKRFQRWLKTAERGDAYVYHTGRLAEDRYEPDGDGGSVGNEIGLVADEAYAAAGRGDVHIYQDRGAHAGEFLYIARRA